MNPGQKVAVGKAELTSVIEERLKRSDKYLNVKYRIIPSAEKGKDQDFTIEILNAAELPWFTVQEARFIIFAPVQRHYKLIGQA